MRTLAIAVFIAAASVHLAFAAPVDATVGRAPVVISEPQGLAALRNQGSPYFKLNTTLQQNAGNRLLAVFIAPAKAKVADEGRMVDTEEWALAFALPREDFEVTRDVFRTQMLPAIEQELNKVLGDPQTRERANASTAKGVESLNREFGGKAKPNVDVGQIRPLGVYAKTADYFAYGAETKASVTDPTGKRIQMPLVMVLTMVNVKNRIFNLALYRRYESEADLAAAKAKALAWADATVRLNR